MNEALKYDAFRKIVGTINYSPVYKDSNGVAKTQDWAGTNRYLLGEAEAPDGIKVLGGKTGTTNAAGYCLTIAAEKESTGEEYISTVMKASSKDELYNNMTALLQKIH
jgi:D-alanyl-D-alanine carboxypeptidase (penicillin-binding protein 5/6)